MTGTAHDTTTGLDDFERPQELPAPDAGARLLPVMDHTHARGHFPWQSRWWRTGEFIIPLDPDLDAPTWGLVMVELLVHLADDEDTTAAAVLRRAVTKLPWALYPGLQVCASDGRVITSGCCASLGEWPAWAAVLDGEPQRFGHEPDVAAWLDGGTVVVSSSASWRPGLDATVEPPVTIVIPRERYEVALAEVGETLGALAARVETWARGLSDPETAAAVANGFRASFHVPG